MKHSFKALLLIVSLFFASAFSAIEMRAQNNLHPEFEGTWVLDSIQVNEIMPDGIKQKTVLQGDYNEFIINWMWEITLNGHGTLLYKEGVNQNFSSCPYIIEDRNENTATLRINKMPGYKIVKVQLLSESSILITHSFTTEHDMQDIDISCKMYYSKSNK